MKTHNGDDITIGFCSFPNKNLFIAACAEIIKHNPRIDIIFFFFIIFLLINSKTVVYSFGRHSSHDGTAIQALPRLVVISL